MKWFLKYSKYFGHLVHSQENRSILFLLSVLCTPVYLLIYFIIWDHRVIYHSLLLKNISPISNTIIPPLENLFMYLITKPINNKVISAFRRSSHLLHKLLLIWSKRGLLLDVLIIFFS